MSTAKHCPTGEDACGQVGFAISSFYSVQGHVYSLCGLTSGCPYVCIKNTPMVAVPVAPRIQITHSRHTSHCESVLRMRWIVKVRVSSTRLLSDQRVEHESYKNVTYGRWAARAFAFPVEWYNSVMQPNSVVVIVGKSTSRSAVDTRKLRSHARMCRGKENKN